MEEILSRESMIKTKSPREAVEESLNNIKKGNSVYNAFITVCEDDALSSAKIAEEEIENGEVKGPLHGVPIALKDVIFTEGIRTTMGSKLYEDFVPDHNSTVVQKLKDAGAIIIGKTNTHEFAYGPTGDRSFFGPCRNPYNPEKITGGSSSGPAAAVAANMVDFTVGTDTGGSIRIPASACGIVGMKPTFGLVSKYGIHNTAYTLDHPGPMTKTVKQNAVLLNVLAGYDEKDPDSIDKEKEDYTSLIGDSISGMVIGLPSFYFTNLDNEVKESIENVIDEYKKMGVSIKKVNIQGIEEIAQLQPIVIQSEAYAVHEKNVATRGSEYDPEVYERLISSSNVPSYKYVVAQQRKKDLIEQFNKVFEEVDVLLTPTLPIIPTNIGQREVTIGDQIEPVRQSLLRLTAPTNYTGNPSISIPCGLSQEGLPIGFQLIGKHREEALLYQFGSAYEEL